MGKEKKKHKKHKKHSKHKKAKHQHTDSSESADEWEEAGRVATPKLSSKLPSPPLNRDGEVFENKKHSQMATINEGVHGGAMRDDWMTSSSLLDTVSGATFSRENKTKKRKLEEKRQDSEKNEAIQKARELNPYLHTTKSESESSQKLQSSSRDDGVADKGSSWIHKAYERAKQRAIDENVPLEDIVTKQWGSMAKLQALLKSASRPISCRQSSEKGTASGWRKNVGTQNSYAIDQRPRVCGESTALKNPRDGMIAPEPKSQMKGTTAVTGKTDGSEATSDEEMIGKNANQQCTAGSTRKREVVHVAQLTEKEKNEIGAKLVRAELMGDDELVEKLKAQLEGRDPGTEVSAKSAANDSDEREVLLTRTDKHGNLYPVRSKTNDGDSDDDNCSDRSKNVQRKHNKDLKAMIEDEHLTSVDDHQKMTAKLASKHMAKTNGLKDDEYYSVDDMFIKAKDTQSGNGEIKEKAVKDAILQKKRTSNCRFCLDNPNTVQHLIISIGTHVYLALPMNASLTEGHCLIIPTDHRPAQTYLDEDVLQEVGKFKKTLKNMFLKQDEDVIFVETCKDVTPGKHHCVIECIPVPKEIGDMGPIYFKKAISESGSEWSSNKKVVTIEARGGVTRALPKGLPYFAVEFGVDGGFGHIIEEESFPYYFGKEIIGGMMDLEPRLWMKPRKESFEQHKRKLFSFNEMWKEFDC